MPTKDPERRRAQRRAYWHRLRQRALDHYGRRCACCGETEESFLAIDHTDGGGTQHRKAEGITGSGIYLWLKKNGYPAGFRTLCHNCNLARGYYGCCPHEEGCRASAP